MIVIPQHIKGIIFDLDGTLADTMPIHYKACQLACREYGVEFPYDFFIEKAGIPTLKVFELFVNTYDHKNIDGVVLGKQKEKLFLDLLSTTQAISAAETLLIQNLGKRKIAIGSGGQKISVVKTLKAIGHLEHIDVIVSADDVTHHKPAPDTFLDCAKKLNLLPNECIVLEDAELGFEAAKQAGMEFIDINNHI